MKTHAKGCEKRMRNGRRELLAGCAYLVVFAVWTLLVKYADVQPVGVNGTDVGLAALNVWVHESLGVNMMLYWITDWLGLVPMCVCMGFGALGLWQLIARRSLQKVDKDLILLGAYYIAVMLCYLLFEEISPHVRPVLIEGRMEKSYPSSTTLLVLCVMPTLAEQIHRRNKDRGWSKGIGVGSGVFSAGMVLGRMLSGVHWAADIAGSALLSAGLYLLYKAAVMRVCSRIGEK